MATKTITSDKQETKVGANGTKLYTSTRTTYNVDSNGKIDSDTVKHEILYYQTPLGSPVVAATSTGNSGKWDFKNDPFNRNQPYFGADAQKSLKEGALKTNTQQQIITAADKENIPIDQQKALSTKQLNTSPISQGTTSPSTLLQLSAIQNQQGTRTQFPQRLVYPTTLKNEYQDVIKFKMLEYVPRTLNQSGFGFNQRSTSSSSKDRKIIGNVILPVPGGISDQNQVSWGEGRMGALEVAVAAGGLGFITGGGEEAAKVAEKIAGSISNNSEDVKKAVAAYFAESATGTTGLLSRTTGAIQNPNLELLFNSPTLRQFSFSFKLSARSQEEAKVIRSIIRFFKQGMSPIRTKSNLFLKSPHTFQLEYLHQNREHAFLNKFKECALLAFSVNYTPEGNYATYYDGAMVSYQITMQFQELDPVFNDEYGNSQNNVDTEIGF